MLHRSSATVPLHRCWSNRHRRCVVLDGKIEDFYNREAVATVNTTALAACRILLGRLVQGMGVLVVGLPDRQLLLTGQIDQLYYYERLELQTEFPTICTCLPARSVGLHRQMIQDHSFVSFATRCRTEAGISGQIAGYPRDP